MPEEYRMCEIFGYSAKKGRPINKYLKEFFSHSNEHPHGWGLACVDGDDEFIEKEPIQASKSHYLKERMSNLICSNTVLAHIRYATIGNVEYVNCHPYTKRDITGRRWTFIHNGTIFDSMPLNGYVKKQLGDTDSERILLYIVDKLNEIEKRRETPLGGEERFKILDCVFSNMAKSNKLNFILFDGEYMYIHTNYKNSLYYLDNEDEIIVSTQPLDNGKWRPVPFARLVACREGKIIFEGTAHGHEYIDNEEDMKFLYQIFSNI